MFMRGSTYLGVDVGTSTIKIVELKKSGSFIKINHVLAVPTPSEAFDGDILIRPHTVSAFLADAVQKHKLVKTGVIGVVPEKQVITRKIRVPAMPHDELEASLRWEVEKYIPVPAKDLVLDFVKFDVHVGHEGKEVDVLIIALPKNIAYTYSKMLVDAGLHVAALDTVPFALRRYYTCAAKSPTQGEIPPFFGCLDIGASGTTVMFFKEDLPVFSRNIPVGGEHLELQELSKEVRRCLNYMKIRWKGLNCEKLFLTGGGSLLQGVGNVLSDELEVPVIPSDPVACLEGTLDPKTPLEIQSQITPTFSVAIGLALREVVA